MYRSSFTSLARFLPVLLLFAAASARQTTLPGAIQTAERLLANTDFDSAAGSTVSEDLYRLCAEFPVSALAPQGLLLAAEIDQRLGRMDDALHTRKRILENYTASEAAPRAFEAVFNDLTGSADGAEEAAELARRLADVQPSKAGHYWNLAFRQYSVAGNWIAAADAGSRALEASGRAGLSAQDLHKLTDAALLAGETSIAVRACESFIDNYGDLPQVISVRRQLGGIYSAQGNPAAAHEQFVRAWSTYQKLRKKPEYDQSAIASAAAASLMALQTEPRRRFDEMTAPELPLEKRVAQRVAAELADAYAQAMTTDPALAPAAFNASGDVYSRMGDALLKNGFRLAMTGTLPTGQMPFTDALPEYTKAVAAFSLAFERSLLQAGEHDAPLASREAETDPAARYAAQRAFEVASGQADAVFAWAIDVNARAPQPELGPNGSDKRFDYLVNTAAPLFARGLELEAAALSLADRMQLPAQAADARLNLDLPLRPFAASLTDLSAEQNRQATVASNQLAATFARGFQNSATSDFADRAEREFHRAASHAAATNDLLGSLLAGLDRCNSPTATYAYWNDRIVAGFHDYATLCRTLQNDLSVCTANLKLRKDDEAAALRKRFAKLESFGSSEEYAGLLRWHQFTVDRQWDHPLNAELQARLNEIDPDTYGRRDDWPAANRKP